MSEGKFLSSNIGPGVSIVGDGNGIVSSDNCRPGTSIFSPNINTTSQWIECNFISLEGEAILGILNYKSDGYDGSSIDLKKSLSDQPFSFAFSSESRLFKNGSIEPEGSYINIQSGDLVAMHIEMNETTIKCFVNGILMRVLTIPDSTFDHFAISLAPSSEVHVTMSEESLCHEFSTDTDVSAFLGGIDDHYSPDSPSPSQDGSLTALLSDRSESTIGKDGEGIGSIGEMLSSLEHGFADERMEEDNFIHLQPPISENMTEEEVAKEEMMNKIRNECEEIRAQERQTKEREDREKEELQRMWRKKLRKGCVADEGFMTKSKSYEVVKDVVETVATRMIFQEGTVLLQQREEENNELKTYIQNLGNEIREEEKMKFRQRMEDIHNETDPNRPTSEMKKARVSSSSSYSSKNPSSSSPPRSRSSITRKSISRIGFKRGIDYNMMYHLKQNKLFDLISDISSSIDEIREVFKECVDAYDSCYFNEEMVFETLKGLVGKDAQLIASPHPLHAGHKWAHQVTLKSNRMTCVAFHPLTNMCAGKGKMGLFHQQTRFGKYSHPTRRSSGRPEDDIGELEEEKDEEEVFDPLPTLHNPIILPYHDLTFRYMSTPLDIPPTDDSDERKELITKELEKVENRWGNSLIPYFPYKTESSQDILNDLFAGAEDMQSWGYEALVFPCKTDQDAIKYISVAKRRVSKGQVLRATDSSGRTMIHLACYFGHLDAVRFLVEECQMDLDISIKHYGGATPLIEAVRGGNPEVVQYLLDCKADYMVGDSMLNLPLHHACRLGDISVVRVLTSVPRTACSMSFIARNLKGMRPSGLVPINNAVLSTYLRSIGADGSCRR